MDGDLEHRSELARQAAIDALGRNIVVIPDFPAPGIRYLDFYRIFDRHPRVRRAVLTCLALRYATVGLDAVAGIGNGGFGLGACLAHELDLPFHPIRKASDTVHGALRVRIGMVYAERELTLADDIVDPGSQVLLVDDSIATGGTLRGAIELLHRAGGRVVEVATVFETTSKGGRLALAPTPLFSILSRDSF